MATNDSDIWRGAYKLPWGEPAFSRRMLREHLTQDHDLASRRVEWIDRQVEWIHGSLLRGQAARILDLGCGPGLYTSRLADRGHRCHGIDIGPASIAYARLHNASTSRCRYTLGDIRRVAFGGPYDLAMILYGELNVFSPADARTILRGIRTSLADAARLVCEMQTPDGVERMGRSEPSEQQRDFGLFSDQPHTWRTESRWLADQQVSIQTFLVADAAGTRTNVYRSTTRAWRPDELTALFAEAGFDVTPCHKWPCNTPDLALWAATCRGARRPR